ncbi:hypothetical protein A8F94_00900 [Bacillus sp. FJAT-27225]|nr:hypothetical protein A8F94_00900 [Bacillus sp. FJAT-27225]
MLINIGKPGKISGKYYSFLVIFRFYGFTLSAPNNEILYYRPFSIDGYFITNFEVERMKLKGRAEYPSCLTNGAALVQQEFKEQLGMRKYNFDFREIIFVFRKGMNAIESNLGTYSSYSNTSHFGCFNGSVLKVNICEFWNKFR